LLTAIGFVTDIGTFAVGRAVSDIGGGRVRAEDTVDHAIAYEGIKKIGDGVRRGETLGIIHCRRQSQADLITAKLREAYKISGVKPGATKLVRASV
jgi:thymidine phosphorylase